MADASVAAAHCTLHIAALAHCGLKEAVLHSTHRGDDGPGGLRVFSHEGEEANQHVGDRPGGRVARVWYHGGEGREHRLGTCQRALKSAGRVSHNGGQHPWDTKHAAGTATGQGCL